MHAQPATTRDLAYVFRQLAPRMAAEYVAAIGDVRAAKNTFTALVRRGQADAIVHDGQTIAVLAWDDLYDGVATSFAARDAYFHQTSVRFSRSHVRDVQARLGNKPLYSISFSQRPDISRWFRLLGFRHHTSHPGGQVFKLLPSRL